MDWLSLVEGTESAAPEWRDILVVGDARLLGLGRRFADRLGCYLKATGFDDPKKAVAQGADQVISGDLEKIITAERPEIVLLPPGFPQGLAHKLRTGMMHAFEVDLDVGARRLVYRIHRFGGKVIEEYACPDARPQMAVVETAHLSEPAPDPARTGNIR